MLRRVTGVDGEIRIIFFRRELFGHLQGNRAAWTSCMSLSYEAWAACLHPETTVKVARRSNAKRPDQKIKATIIHFFTFSFPSSLTCSLLGRVAITPLQEVGVGGSGMYSPARVLRVTAQYHHLAQATTISTHVLAPSRKS